MKLTKSSGQMFEPVGSLRLAFDHHETFSNYRRELDISTGIATTTYTVGGTRYTRQVFASLPDRLILVRLTADKPGSLSLRAFYTSPDKNAHRKTTAARELFFIEGRLDLGSARERHAILGDHAGEAFAEGERELRELYAALLQKAGAGAALRGAGDFAAVEEDVVASVN